MKIKEISCANCKNNEYPGCNFPYGLAVFLEDYGKFGKTILPALLKAAAEKCKPDNGYYHYEESEKT